MAAFTYVNGVRIASLEDGYYVRKTNDTEVFCTDFNEALKLAGLFAFHKDMIASKLSGSFISSIMKLEESS